MNKSFAEAVIKSEAAATKAIALANLDPTLTLKQIGDRLDLHESTICRYLSARKGKERNSQAILDAIASPPHGKNFRQILAIARVGISPQQMVVELRKLKESGLIYFTCDPKHKCRFLYYPVNNNAQEN